MEPECRLDTDGRECRQERITGSALAVPVRSTNMGRC